MEETIEDWMGADLGGTEPTDEPEPAEREAEEAWVAAESEWELVLGAGEAPKPTVTGGSGRSSASAPHAEESEPDRVLSAEEVDAMVEFGGAAEGEIDAFMADSGGTAAEEIEARVEFYETTAEPEEADGFPATSPGDRDGLDHVAVLDGIRDLRDNLASYQSLEHYLIELLKTTELNHQTVAEDLAYLRTELDALRQEGPSQPTARAPVFAARDLRSRAGIRALKFWRPGDAEEARRRRALAVTLTFALGSLLLLGWAVRDYATTGSVLSAVVSLLVVNLCGVATVLVHRRN